MVAGERLICPGTALVEGGQGWRFEVDGEGGKTPAFAVRYRGQVHAYLNRCAHVPMELDWKPGEFFDVTGLYLICTTHGALYDPATGICHGGRCDRRGLEKLPVVERNGEVFLYQEGD